MTSLDDYQREAAHFRSALKALRTTAKEPGRPEATERQQGRSRDLAEACLRKIIEGS